MNLGINLCIYGLNIEKLLNNRFRRLESDEEV